MFDTDRIDGLSAAEAADELVASVGRLVAAEAAQFRLVAHWADLHAPEYVEQCLELSGGLPGRERVVPAGAEGTALMGEFCGAELGALLGVSTHTGEALIADAVNVRHRHPLLWARIAEGRVRVWLARKVARRCAEAELTLEQALWVDARTTPYLATLPAGRFLRLVEATIVAADPESAEARAHEEALARFARAGRVDAHGLRTFVARAAAGDVSYLVAVLDRIAAVLRSGGDSDPVEARRATALRILANPARALALLTQATLDGLDAHDPEPSEDGVPCAADNERERERVRSLHIDGEGDAGVLGEHEPVTWMVDASGQPLPPTALRSDLGLDNLDPVLDGMPRAEVLGGGDPAAPEEALDPHLLRVVLEALRSFDTARLDPVAVLHVHVSAETLARDEGVENPGVARVEGLGPVVASAARAWLATTAGEIRLRPVVDFRGLAAVDGYEHTPLMREAVATRMPHEVFPYGTLASRGADMDHPRPYRPPAEGGPPGQTGLHNAAPLSRKHHRLKTCGGWRLRQPEPGVYWWRTPHGHWFRVDQHGTHHHGRDPHLDALGAE